MFRALAQKVLDRASSLLAEPAGSHDEGPSFESRTRVPTPFRRFEIRWAEPVGLLGCPYLRRWVITAFGRSVRLHHWLASDDQRNLHDHPWDYAVLILKGGYCERTPLGVTYKGAGSLTRYPAEHRHTVIVTRPGAWSLLVTGPVRRHWGFYVKGRERLMRPLRYFSRYGHHPCE